MIFRAANFFKNTAYTEAMENCREWGSALHLMGLLSDGGVHSHITHLFCPAPDGQEQGIEKVYVHCFLDGRDVPPPPASTLSRAPGQAQQLGGQIATVMGRYYAMDQDKRWDPAPAAYDAMVCGQAPMSRTPRLRFKVL